MSRSHVTTHVLDAVTGRPAAGLAARLEDGTGALLGLGVTDEDGRIADLGPAHLPAGTYRVVLDTGLWFSQQDRPAFYPEVVIAFRIDDPAQHYHVPVLLSPYSYSTYRGS